MQCTRNFIRGADGKRVMPPAPETLMRMFVTDGMEAQEIAATLGFTPKQIKNALHRRGIRKGGPKPIIPSTTVMTSAVQELSQKYLSERL